jgi:hypothetical protein
MWSDFGLMEEESKSGRSHLESEIVQDERRTFASFSEAT